MELDVESLHAKLLAFLAHSLEGINFKRRGNVWSKKIGENVVKFHIRKSKFGMPSIVTYGLILGRHIKPELKMGNEDFHVECRLEKSIGRIYNLQNYHWTLSDNVESIVAKVESTFLTAILPQIEKLALASTEELYSTIEDGYFDLCYLHKSELLKE